MFTFQSLCSFSEDLSCELSLLLQLKKEVFQLAQELKQARCEIEDLRRMVGEGKQGPKETLSTEVNVCLIFTYIHFTFQLIKILFPVCCTGGAGGTSIPEAAGAEYMGL